MGRKEIESWQLQLQVQVQVLKMWEAVGEELL
jgi:hypothetical protein